MTSTNPVIQTAIRAAMETAIPEGSLTVSKWAAQYRYVSLDRVANPALAGRWKNETTPYLVEIMDAVNDPNCNEIIFVKSSQVAGTEFGCNVIGYHIHIDPAKIIYCAETEPKARAFGVEALDPMIRDTPVLRDRVAPAKSRNAENTSERKVFPGGMLNIVWATSPSQLSSRPARVVILDEEDAYESTKEGSPTELAKARMKTAGDQAKLIRISTPRTKELSPIYLDWLDSPQKKLFVPCPHCGAFQILNWLNEGQAGHVRWDSPETTNLAYYVCVNGCVIDHDDKNEMVSLGEWRATNPDYVGTRQAFFLHEVYSPFSNWGDMAKGWLEANEAWKTHKDKSKLQVFLNTRLAQWWEDIGEQVDYQNLEGHLEDYEAEVPDGVLVLTAAVDTQGDRLECEIVGWGRDGESWAIAYFVLYGDPALRDVWEDLYDILDAEYETRDGVMKVKCACIDSGGHHANEVYKFCKANAGRRWYAVKGASTSGKVLVSKPSRNNRYGVRLFSVGTDTAKDSIFSYLQVHESGPGYWHFPSEPFQGEPYNARYFQQLCSEKKIIKWIDGQQKYKYVKVNPKGDESGSARNEALDIRVYNLAALEILNPNFKALAKRRENLPQKTEISENNLENNVKVSQNLPKQPSVTVNKGGGTWANKW